MAPTPFEILQLQFFRVQRFHYAPHGDFQVINVQPHPNVPDRPADVAWSDIEELLGRSRHPSNTEFVVDHQNRYNRAAQKIGKIIAETAQFPIAVLQLLVECVQFLVARLQLFFRSFQLFVDTLQFLVARLYLLICGSEILVCRIALVNEGLHALAGQQELLFKALNIGGIRLRFTARPCAAGLRKWRSPIVRRCKEQDQETAALTR